MTPFIPIFLALALVLCAFMWCVEATYSRGAERLILVGLAVFCLLCAAYFASWVVM